MPTIQRARALSRSLAGLCFLLVFTAAAPAQKASPRPEDAEGEYLPYGGHHELGAWAGFSAVSGPVWGYARDTRYAVADLRYSFRIRRGRHIDVRYAPEVTLVADLFETQATQVNPFAPAHHLGAGVSPEGFQLVFRPFKRVQPYWSNAGGFVYYADRVLSPQGSQWMYTIDFGAGVNLFTARRNAITLGFRYQHFSNANISMHNPGTDADTITLGFSHFHTKGIR
jgi:hypothetical protein